MIEDSSAYYVRRQGRVEGPWPIAKLRAEIELRKLGRHHEVSTDGVHWQRAGEVEGLFISVTTRKRVGRPTPAASATPQVEAAPSDDDEFELDLDDEPAPNRIVAWYYSVDDRQVGPVRDDEIVFGVEGGRLPLGTLVWREGYADWVTVEEAPELMRRINNAWQTSAASYPPAKQSAESSPERPRYPNYALWGGVITLLLSWIPFVGFAGLLPIVFGILGINEINAMEGHARGRGGAIAGIMLGMASMALAAIELTAIGFVLWQKLVE